MEAYGHQSPSDEMGYLIYCPTQEELEDDFIEDLEDGFIWGGGNDVIEDDKSRVQIEAMFLYQGRDGNTNVTRRTTSTTELPQERSTIGAEGQVVQNALPNHPELELGVYRRSNQITNHDPGLRGGYCNAEKASIDSSNSLRQNLGTGHFSIQIAMNGSGLGGDCNVKMASMDPSNPQRQTLGTDQCSKHHRDPFLGEDHTVETAPMDPSNSQRQILGTDQRSNHHHEHSLEENCTFEMAPIDPSSSTYNHEGTNTSNRQATGCDERCERTNRFKHSCFCKTCLGDPRDKLGKPYQCYVCTKRFDRNRTLINHMRTHTGERPYLCSVCGRAFSQKHSQVSHMKTHAVERPYEYHCTICNRGCHSKSRLAVHLRTHTGEKPCESPVCKKRFSEPRCL